MPRQPRKLNLRLPSKYFDLHSSFDALLRVLDLGLRDAADGTARSLRKLNLRLPSKHLGLHETFDELLRFFDKALRDLAAGGDPVSPSTLNLRLPQSYVDLGGTFDELLRFLDLALRDIETTQGDPHFASVVLLCAFDGTDGSTTFTDESSNGHTITANGNAQLDTSQGKFGTASGLFDGSGDYLSVAEDGSFQGSQVLTAECFLRLAALPGATRYTVLSKRPGSGNSGWTLWVADSTNILRVVAWGAAGTAVAIIDGATALLADTWYHVAVTRDASGLWTLWLNGTSDGAAQESAAVADNAHDLSIGRDNNAGFYFNGWIDEFRFTTGVARYTTNFTPPTEAFPRS